MVATGKIFAIPIIACGAICWTGDYNLKNSNSDEQLIYVHLFHRHGHKTPGRLIHSMDKEFEDNLWIKRLSKQYYNANKLMDETKTGCNNDNLYRWTYINQKLNGTYLQPTNIALENGITVDKKVRYVWCGQITEKGVSKTQDVGRWLRDRYVYKYAFLPSTYQSSYDDSTKLCVESSNYKRCIFSADSLLYGLYSNRQRTKGNRIPISVDLKYNHWLSYKSKNREYHKTEKALKKIMSQTDWMSMDTLDIHNKLVDIYKSDNIEYDQTMISALKCRIYENVDLPTNIDEKELKKYVYAKYDLYLDFFKRNDMFKSSSGVPVLLNRLLNSIKYETNKFVISSCHDITIAPLLWCLLRCCKDENVVNKFYKWPKYGDCLIFEVWRINDKRCIRVLYNQDVLKVNGKEYIEMDELEDMWKDLVLTKNAWLKSG